MSAASGRTGHPTKLSPTLPMAHSVEQDAQFPGTAGAAAQSLRVGIVAGESSGDQLGAALITALRARVPSVQCFGVAGPKMIAAGCEAWAAADELAVMGLTEVLHHLPRLMRLRASLVARFRAARARARSSGYRGRASPGEQDGRGRTPGR